SYLPHPAGAERRPERVAAGEQAIHGVVRQGHLTHLWRTLWALPWATATISCSRTRVARNGAKQAAGRAPGEGLRLVVRQPVGVADATRAGQMVCGGRDMDETVIQRGVGDGKVILLLTLRVDDTPQLVVRTNGDVVDAVEQPDA